MAKEYRWKTTIAGKACTVFCVPENGRYVLYVNDDYLATVYRKAFQNMAGGIDEKIEIFGQECRFVVWDEQVDLAVDGKFLTKGTDYAEAVKKQKNMRRIVAMIELASVPVLTAVFFLGDQNWGLLVAAVLFLIHGIVQLRRIRG